MSGPENKPAAPSGFDKLAAPYRWLEYLSFGPMLMRTRVALLPEMLSARRALILGDGDGRFCAALMRSNSRVHVHAVDISPAMLALLRRKVERIGATDRLSTHPGDLRHGLPSGPFDLVCTHFLLDCLDEAEVAALVSSVREHMHEGCWVVSEFAIPGGLARGPATVLIGLLYRAFGLLTGLQVRSLPAYGAILQANGYICRRVQSRIFGLLRSELWAPHERNAESK